jgi:S-formylglutathione hydrolase
MTIETKETHKCFGGVQGVYRHASTAVSGTMELSVFVPPAAEAGPCPVLFYLSGLTCTQENVTTKGGFQRVASELGLVIVCPDTSPRGTGYPGEDDSYDFGSGAGFYVDATQAPWSATYRMYSYVVDELPRVVAANFPADLSRAGICGHSMGGHGALTIGLRHPDKFRSISAFAPIVAPSQVPWGEKAFTGYLGDNREAWKAHDAVELIKAGRRAEQTILIDQGLADPFYEKQLKPELFETACRAAGQPLELRRHEGYDHSYFFIATFMADHLRHHAAILVA